jgi:flavin reductase (DIM6/NTAB) family NADH-FMN oxidoreductase RutF
MIMPVKTIYPKDTPTHLFHGYLLGAVAPRPIAFASTTDSQGNINLSPFSFFNVFGSNPPTLVFSPSRRVRDNSIKHTLENIYEVKEVVINMVNYAMVQQTSLASCEYDKGVNEFVKAGFTASPSALVKPPRVEESPVAFECKVNQVIETGKSGGAGNLVICEVLLMHVKEEILNEKGQIDPHKIDLVARMGGDWYCRASGDALFEVPKPNQKKGVGIDQIPYTIRNSRVLTGNDLGMLGNIEAFPDRQAIADFSAQPIIQSILAAYRTDEDLQVRLHRTAQSYLREGKLTEAWLTLLQKA